MGPDGPEKGEIDTRMECYLTELTNGSSSSGLWFME